MFAYRVSRGGKVVFEAEARAPKVARQPQRFVAFGDCGAGTPEQKAIAYRTFLSKPDYVMIPGDIVYGKGLVSEYRDKFWPIYNADEPSPSSGAPLLRSTLFVAAPGNHDIASRDLGKTARRPGLLLLLVPAAERPGRAGGRPDHGPGARPRGEQEGLPRRRRLGLPPNGELLLRLRRRPLDRPRRQSPRSTGPIPSCGSGSSATWPPPGAPPGGSSASTSRDSTRPRSISTSSTCGSSPPSSRPARWTSYSTGTSTTTSGVIPCGSSRPRRTGRRRSSDKDGKLPKSRHVDGK